MNIKMRLAGLFLGLVLATTSIFAHEGSCGAGKCGGEAKKEMKCACDSKDKKEKCNCENKEKCNCDMKKDMKGSCGAGKCGSEMKKDTKGSCGAGKCGSESSNEMKAKTNN